MTSKRRFSLFKSFKLEQKIKSDEPNEKEDDSKKAAQRSISYRLKKTGSPNKFYQNYGRLSAFGDESNGSGPYKSILISKDVSQFSFESTRITHLSTAISTYEEFSPPTVSSTQTSNYIFKNSEIVWAKQILYPWFPGIIIDPNQVTKQIKDLLKEIDAPLPSEQELDYKDIAYQLNREEKIYFVFLFDKKKSWVWLPNTKLKPFSNENNVIFSESSQILSNKSCKELKKAIKKAIKINKIMAKKRAETEAFSFFGYKKLK